MIDIYRAPLDARTVKAKARELGADLVGIADSQVLNDYPADPDDPRIPADQQQNNDMYRSANGNPNPLDRGHLVRRLDPCWGDTLEEVIAAHGPRVPGHAQAQTRFSFVFVLVCAQPEACDEDIHWCYQNVSGALALTLAQTGRIDRLSDGKCLSSDFDAAYDHMIPFIAAGFRAVCASPRG